MSKPPAKKKVLPAQQLLAAVPYRNVKLHLERRDEGLLVSIPVRRPAWLMPPLSWILPFSPQRRVQLDGPGTEVFDLCDSKRSIESIIDRFAAGHKLSFRESQLAVSAFLRQLVERGLIVIVGPGND